MRFVSAGRDDLPGKNIMKLHYSSDEIPRLQLFNSSDVILGNPGSNIALAFVYTWPTDNPPENIREFMMRMSNYCAMAGYWRTTNGAKYAFANILANPNINKLVLVVFNAKDNGHLLVECLSKFWKNGTDKNGIVKDSRAPNPKFEQVNAEALERIRKQADLIVLNSQSESQFDHIEKIIKSCFQEPQNALDASKENLVFHSNYHDLGLVYDDGARFEEPYFLDLSMTAKNVKFEEKRLSVSLGKSVQAENLREAFEFIAGFIFRNGTSHVDQRNIITLECRSFTIAIINPLSEIPNGFSGEYLRKYTDEFIHGSGGKEEFVYTYHERIFRKWGNQVEKAIRLLEKNDQSRRAVISLWDPGSDLDNDSPPCLNMINLAVRDNKLELHVLFRSHHLATVTKDGRLLEGEGAFIPNMYAMAKLQEFIARKLNIETGPLVLTDFSGHLYVSDI